MGTRIHRVFVDTLQDVASEVVLLAPSEQHYVTKTLRLRPGDALQVLDGKGRVAEGILTQDGDVHIQSCRRALMGFEEPLLIAAVAMPKGDRADWLVEKCAELGVSHLVPLVTEYSNPIRSLKKVERWRRCAEAAMRQCGRVWAMHIDAPVALSDWLGSTLQHDVLHTLYGRLSSTADSTEPPSVGRRVAKIVLDPYAERYLEGISESEPENASVFYLAVGPEGGWSRPELALLETHGYIGAKVGEWVLRIETAVVSATVCLQSMFRTSATPAPTGR